MAAVVMLVSALLLASRRAAGVVPRRIACVGDSITHGFHASSAQKAYPGQLQRLLGPGYLVEDCGHTGASLLTERPGKNLYRQSEQFNRSLAFAPDTVVIMLGTNDAVDGSLPSRAAEFVRAYGELIAVYRGLPSKPEILVAQSPPLYKDSVYNLRQATINWMLQQLIHHVADANGLPSPVPVFNAFSSHCPDFRENDCDWISGQGWPYPTDPNAHDDGAHPNDEGYLQMAYAVQLALTGQRGEPGVGRQGESGSRPASLDGKVVIPEGPRRLRGLKGTSVEKPRDPAAVFEPWLESGFEWNGGDP